MKANGVSTTTKSSAGGFASAAMSTNNTTSSRNTQQGVFMLSLVKLLNVNTNRVIKNGTTEVNKDLLSRLQSALSHASSVSRRDDPVRDAEVMRRANCYAIFHRQYRLAYVQEVEFIHLFRNRKFLTRSNIIYFEEGREKKVITYDRLLADLHHIQSTLNAASEHHGGSVNHHHHHQHQSIIGKMYEFLQSTQELKAASTVAGSRSNYAIMITLYMMLVSDVMKHPSNAIINVMILDLIMKDKLHWGDAINFSEQLATKAGVVAAFNSTMTAAYAVAAGSSSDNNNNNEEEERFVKQVAVDQSHYKILLTMASKTLQLQSKYLGVFFNEISEMNYVYDSILPNNQNLMNTLSSLGNTASSKNDDPLQQVDPCVELSWSHFQLLVEKECLIINMWLQSEGINPFTPLVAISATDTARTAVDKQTAALFEMMIERIVELCNMWYCVDLSEPKIR